jgi:hypothetical protein
MKEQPKKSFLNIAPYPVLGYGPPHPTVPELIEDKQAIHNELKKDQKRRTVRVRPSLLP